MISAWILQFSTKLYINYEIPYEKSYESSVNVINNSRHMCLCVFIFIFAPNFSRFIHMLKATVKWQYSILVPLGVLSLSINLYRVSIIDIRLQIVMKLSNVFYFGQMCRDTASAPSLMRIYSLRKQIIITCLSRSFLSW